MSLKVDFSLNRNKMALLVQTAKEKGAVLLHSEASAHNQALGFALGTFISLLPTPGLNFALAFLLAGWLRQIHRATLLASLAVWNVFVTAPFFALSYRLGNYLFPAPTTASVTTQWQAQVASYIKGFLVGNLIIAVTVTAVSYGLVLLIFWFLHKKQLFSSTSVSSRP